MAERCQECHTEYNDVYIVPDHIWYVVTGKLTGAGLLCMQCFTKLAKEKGIIPFWSCGDREYPSLRD